MKPAMLGLGLAAGAGAALALRARKASTPGWSAGNFPAGMGYVKFGTGVRSVLWIPDPSHAEPTTVYLRFMAKAIAPFVHAGYTVHLVGLRPHLPAAATVSDFADDYAKLIMDDFHGRVDLLVADSQGGVIGFALAARHPHLFGSFAAVAASHTLEPTAREATLESARLLSEGRRAEAADVMVQLQNPWLRTPWLRSLMASVMARVIIPAEYDRRDVLLAAQAVNDPEVADILPTIAVPVLLVCGDADHFVSAALYERTARLIPDSTLTVYSGKGHLGVLSDPRLAPDILSFAARPIA
ncbi:MULTISPECIES: alpha/beta fold hydrolase [unclassified Ornithinimicrobium]|uniref:alpha/beta fold hydrolase n=1 Tax=unclassified Ornithinimicrobium TaxID=2615080 RepID=UPI0038531F2E